MNTQTYILLKKELEENEYGIFCKNTIEKLFNLYTKYEITSFRDFFAKDHKDFYRFVKDNIPLFKNIDKDEQGKITEEDKKFLLTSAHSCVMNFNVITSKYFDSYRKEQENFVSLVEKLACNNNTNILEVGSGKIPYSSMLIAQDLGHVNSMDKFAISNESLKSMDINPLKEYFNENTQIDNYDFVVGNKPCTAIQHIVKLCTKAKKPYFIGLCDCETPTKRLDYWDTYLKLIDKKIKFSKNYEYAYNVDTPIEGEIFEK